jgi:hypothetical protein
MEGVSLLEWLYVAVVFCGFAWLMWKEVVGVAGRMCAGKFGASDFLLSLLMLTMGGGLLWFMLWMLTDGLVPHGLYGFGIASAALVVMFLADAIKRKRSQ